MFPPFVVPYVIGLVTAPLVAKVAKPLLRDAAKATIGFSLQVRKIAAEAVEDLQDLAAEANAEVAAAAAEANADVAIAEIAKRPGGLVARSSKRG